MGYEKRVVAFIDILGFKNIVNDPVNYANIEKVATAIRAEKKDTDKWNKLGKDENFLETYFSDSMIISSTFEHGGFYHFLNQVAFFMQMITECGFVARGGIAVGNLYHKDGVVFGPALIEAVKIESDLAIYPRVLMSEKTYLECVEIDDLINNKEYRKHVCDTLVQEVNNEIKEKYYYVDYLVQKENFETDQEYEDFLKKTKVIVEKALKNISDKHVRDKYVWLKQYLMKVLKDNGLKYENL